MQQRAISHYCQKCRAANPLGQDFCLRCGTKLMIIVEPLSSRIDSVETTPREEYLLERLTILENNLARLAERLEQGLKLLLQQSETTYANRALVRSLIAILIESGIVDKDRLEMARQLGATEILLSDESLNAKLLQLTDGEGVDMALEAVGRNETVAAAIDGVRKGGGVVLVGNIAPNVNLPLQKVVTRQIRLQGSCASAGEYPQAIRWMASGTIRVKPLITVVAPLEEGASWFERLYAREPNLLKVVLTPGTSP